MPNEEYKRVVADFAEIIETWGPDASRQWSEVLKYVDKMYGDWDKDRQFAQGLFLGFSSTRRIVLDEQRKTS